MSTSRIQRTRGGSPLQKTRLGSPCARACSAGILIVLLASGCATGHMWNALTRTEHNRNAMYYEPGTEASWVDYVGAVLLVPITLVIDIVLSPVQVVGGYWPYGDKDPP